MSDLNMLPDTDLAAQVAAWLVKQDGIGSISPAAANDLTVRSFAIEKVILLAPRGLQAELWKFVYALRYAGEMQFALSGAVLLTFERMVKAQQEKV